MTGRKDNRMETVKFTINVISPNMCRIVPNDIRSKFKEISDGGCITSLDVMLAEMDSITKECAELGITALFEM